MRTKLFTNEELFDMGFSLMYEASLEDNLGYYETYGFKKNDSILLITYTNDAGGNIDFYVEFNDQELKGRTITKADILLLKELM